MSFIAPLTRTLCIVLSVLILSADSCEESLKWPPPIRAPLSDPLTQTSGSSIGNYNSLKNPLPTLPASLPPPSLHPLGQKPAQQHIGADTPTAQEILVGIAPLAPPPYSASPPIPKSDLFNKDAVRTALLTSAIAFPFLSHALVAKGIPIFENFKKDVNKEFQEQFDFGLIFLLTQHFNDTHELLGLGSAVAASNFASKALLETQLNNPLNSISLLLLNRAKRNAIKEHVKDSPFVESLTYSTDALSNWAVYAFLRQLAPSTGIITTYGIEAFDINTFKRRSVYTALDFLQKLAAETLYNRFNSQEALFDLKPLIEPLSHLITLLLIYNFQIMLPLDIGQEVMGIEAALFSSSTITSLAHYYPHGTLTYYVEPLINTLLSVLAIWKLGNWASEQPVPTPLYRVAILGGAMFQSACNFFDALKILSVNLAYALYLSQLPSPSHLP